MAKKTATVKKGETAAYQELLGWSGGDPSIDKVKDAKNNPAHKKGPGSKIEVDDGLITSSAGQKVYWIWGTKFYFVKQNDVDL